MRQTINTIIAFFIILPALLLSYHLGTPSISNTKAGIGEYLNEPALKIHPTKAIKTVPQKTLPSKRQDAKELETSANSVLAFDFKQDFFLYEKNINERRPIASLTKLITSAVTLDYSRLDEIVSVSKEAISSSLE